MTSRLAESSLYKLTKQFDMIFYFLMAIFAIIKKVSRKYRGSRKYRKRAARKYKKRQFKGSEK